MVLAAVYVATAKLGLTLALPGTNATAVWAPTGISLAALLLFGFRLWPGVAVGAFLANAGTGIPVVAVAAITAGNTLEAVAGTWLLRRAGFRTAIDRVRDVVALGVLAATFSTLISASFGVVGLRIGAAIPTSEMPHVFRVWWFGDMSGDLVVAAGILVLASRPYVPRSAARWAEAAAVLASLAVVTHYAVDTHAPRVFLVFPWTIYAAIRFRQPGAVAVSAVIFTIATWAVVHGHGIFAPPDTPNGLVLSQAFVGVNCVVMLMLAAVITEREAAREEALRAVRHLTGAHELSVELADATTVAEVSSALVAVGVPAGGGSHGWVALADADGDVGHVQMPAAAAALARDAIASGAPVWPSANAGTTIAALPLRSAGKVVGSFLVAFEAPGRFGREEQQLLMGIAAQGSQALERTRRFEREREIADVLQQSMLPERLPAVPGVELAATYLPASTAAEVGGDWYDALELGDSRLLLAVGDVVGHGLEAAKSMGQLRNALRAYALDDPAPARLLERLSVLVDRLEHGELTTLAVALIDLRERTVRIAAAGHPPPLLVPPDGPPRYVEEGRGVPLGAGLRGRYEETTVGLAPGTAIVLYTDGLVERRDAPIDDGLARLADSAAGPGDAGEVQHQILEALLNDHGARHDDVAVVVCRLVPTPPEVLTLRVPAVPTSLAKIRVALAAFLTGADLDAAQMLEIQVACGEACSNAIEHAYGLADAAFRVHASIREGALEIVVRDYGTWRDPRGRHRGRGRLLMNELMDDVDIRRLADGTEVHLRRRLTSGALT